MLRYLRSGGVAQVIVALSAAAIILVFAVEFRPGRGALSKLRQECAVEYAGPCINHKDYFASYGIIVPRGLEGKDVRSLQLRKRVLDGLAERELLVREAEALGLGVSNDAVENELEQGRAHVSLPAESARLLNAKLGLCRYRENGAGCEPGAGDMVRQLRVRRTPTDPFDYKLYEREIRIAANRGPREFKHMQERELLAARMRDLVRSRVRVSDEEAKFISQRAVIRSATLNRDWFSKYAIDLTPATVDAWVFEHRAEVDAAWEHEKASYVAGCLVVREIVFPLAGPIFDDQTDPTREKALEVRERLAKGEDFGLVARELSQAPSALLGGELGCLTKDSGPGAEELLKAAETLEPGKPSDPVQTPRGYHIIEVTGRLTPENAEAVGRQKLARALYVRFAGDAAAHAFATELVESAKAGNKLEDLVREGTERAAKNGKFEASPRASKAPKSLESIALAAADRPRFEVSMPFNRSGNPLPELTPKEPIAPKAFELTEPDAVYARPLETDTGFLVFQLKELVKPEDEQKELALIKDALVQIKGDDALTRYVAELRQKAGDKLKVDASLGEERTQSEEQ